MIQHLFLFIGATPNTGWLSESGVALDPKGFVTTGGDCDTDRRPLETSRRGIFAIGDVRSGSVKRVAAAVGEGAQVVATLHAFLAERSREVANSRVLCEADDSNCVPGGQSSANLVSGGRASTLAPAGPEFVPH